MRKIILPLCLLLAACQTTQPTVESINAQQAAMDGKCEKQGYKRGTKDFYTCLQLAQTEDARTTQNAMYGTGAALTGLSLLAAFSDERLKRDIVPVGKENGFNLYRFRYLWSDEEYIGVLAQEVRHTRPDAVLEDSSGYLKVDYGKIGVLFRKL
ncbi:tail fiber domain-containing protein [Bradyrhizobium diazoefficiens]|uniref:tail fiber domain-containing protein n=1 Tax=Bradyrhizobium diazoefficiens TaxID=1355477 RepID=UPI00190DA8B9|nr:tail fiber domain-containing protein [Bradyrhizobium diazoefficiens]MBK3666263.1 tail fiber domain-containing protein [Bradyrhizobium diazoefficiens]